MSLSALLFATLLYVLVIGAGQCVVMHFLGWLTPFNAALTTAACGVGFLTALIVVKT